MALRVCVLASGSAGNCTYIGSDRAALLIDAGLSGRETARRLGEIGADLAAVHAVCVSHEHDDHTAGLGVLHRKHGIPVYANSGTVEGLRGRVRSNGGGIAWTIFSTGSAFEIAGFVVEPFSVPHDAMDPVGFVVRRDGFGIGVVTDIGVCTNVVRDRLKDCQVIVFEANHDEAMLANARRPENLKQRIRGRQGHLSNKAAAEFIAGISGPHLQHVYLAHISEDCNKRSLALATTERVLQKAGHAHVKVSLTYADKVSDVWAR